MDGNSRLFSKKKKKPPAYSNFSSMDLGTALIIVATVLLSFTTISVVLHLIFRFGVLKYWGYDDFCVIGATAISIGMLVSINWGKLDDLAFIPS